MLRMLGVAAMLLWLTGCTDDAEPTKVPMTVEASYRLLYNDTLVGSTLFVLDISANGDYRIDAFTVPAGKMKREDKHEVLESSRGSLDGGDIRPAVFEQSVLQGEMLTIATLTFDWEQQLLTLKGPDGSHSVGLLPETHDHLSYLLAAYRLAEAGKGSALIQVSSPEASEENRLEVTGIENMETPLGNFDAVVVLRITPDNHESRQLWYAPKSLPLPLRVLQKHDGNAVDMRLEKVIRYASDPR